MFIFVRWYPVVLLHVCRVDIFPPTKTKFSILNRKTAWYTGFCRIFVVFFSSRSDEFRVSAQTDRLRWHSSPDRSKCDNIVVVESQRGRCTACTYYTLGLRFLAALGWYSFFLLLLLLVLFVPIPNPVSWTVPRADTSIPARRSVAANV